MFDLKPGVGLDEIVGVVVPHANIQQEFERSKPAIPSFGGNAHSRLVDGVAQILRQVWSGREFDNFLVTSLECAIAVPKGDNSFAIAHDLHLDMADMRQIALGK